MYVKLSAVRRASPNVDVANMGSCETGSVGM